MIFAQTLGEARDSSTKVVTKKEGLIDSTAAPFSMSFSQLPAAKKHQKQSSCDIIRVLLLCDSFITRLSQLLQNSGQNDHRQILNT
jgi:hypothetical protein